MEQKCYHCGSYIPETASFCETCGAPVRQAQNYQPVPPPAPQSNNHGLIIALVVLLVLLLFGGVAFFIINQKKQAQAEKEQMAQQALIEQEKDAAEQRAFEAEQEAKLAKERAETQRETGAFNFTGTVAGQKVTMHLDVDSYGNASGWYYYNKYRKKLGLSGTYSNGYITLTEYDTYGDYSGDFYGTYNGRHATGSMTNIKGDTYSFQLSR